MTENLPTTRAQAAAAAEQLVDAERTISDYAGSTTPVVLEAQLAESAPDFLPLTVRRVLYIVGLAAIVLAPGIGVELPQYAEAIERGGELLAAVAIGTALANPTRR